jgi:hypothetical protein
MPKLRLANQQEVEVPQSAIDAAYLAAHPATTPAATTTPATTPGTIDPTVAALRDVVQTLATAVTTERTERRSDQAALIVDPMIKKGKIKPADRDRFIALYLSDRPSFDFVVTKLDSVPGTRVADPNRVGTGGEFGTGESGDEGDHGVALNSGENGDSDVNPGADARWNREVNRVIAEQNVDVREAARVVQMRDPALYHKRREELAGMRLPNTTAKHNRHQFIQ